MARALMDEGDAKVDAQDYEGALRAYRAAHTIMNVPTTGIEVARTEGKLGRLVEAHHVADEVARMPAKPGEPKPFTEARDQAKALVTELEARIPTVRLVVTGVPTGAPIEVKIDGTLVPSEDVREPQQVNPGKHEIVASASGFSPVSREVEVVEAQRIEVELALGGPPTKDEQDKPGRRLSPLVYAGFGVGGAGLIAGTITGILSLSRAGKVEELCPGGACTTQDKLDEARPENQSALTLANVSNVAFALGVVGVGVGVAGIFLSGGEAKKSPESAALSSLRVRVGPTGVGISGQF